ncbi:GIY-YIG nuclease family protein [Bradyrhizobium sp. 197]|uniref:GIY-YIG nuclease family protein n=1 Tax=Bradyrhizobium sp. 197 TaxID=2782663 RepID=UPI001FF90CA7|nr:GIY-YIG nuclease family protein [Bradyrhizobium sp. 197]MCK1479359.1 GIY-YIG nuclease family protein [Bradyrhizobium sp. 197]
MTIYLLSTGRKLKKIGISSKTDARHRAIQTANGGEIALTYSKTVPADIAPDVERRAHWLLREFKRRGEWFAVGAGVAIAAIDRAIQERGEGEKARSGAGRPSLGVKETKVRLNDDQPDRIEALVGKNRMAEFIREAVERELKRREKRAVNNSGT